MKTLPKSLILLLCLVALGAAAGAREIKEKLIGTWHVDAEASLAHFKDSAKAKALKPKERDKALENMQAFIKGEELEFRFRKYDLALTNKGVTTFHGLKLARASGKVIVYNSTIPSRSHIPIQFRVTFLSDTTITIEATDSKDLELYVWKKMPEEKAPAKPAK